MLKETDYIDPDSTHRTQPGRVMYLIKGRRCIFSGQSSFEEHTSTHNAAEHVILAIAQAEQIDPKSITFYDLQTEKIHTDLTGKPFRFLQLTLAFPKGGGFKVESWTEDSCSPEILREFGIAS